MDASVEQIVLDYLSELADAAQRILRPDERLTFMARSRAAIARQVGETRVAEAKDVRRLLGLFGDPEKLAAQERQRLDEAAPAGQPPCTAGKAGETAPSGTSDPPSAPAALSTPPQQRAAAASSGPRPFSLPTPHRPMTARWRPGGSVGAGSRQGMPWDHTQPDLLAPGRDVPERLPWNRVAVPRPAAPGPLGLPVWWSQPADPEAEQPGDEDDELLGGLTDDAGPDPHESWPAAILTLARRHPLEVAAILMIAAGVLIYPFPLWLFGVLIILLSRLLDVRDKVAVLAVPIAVMLLGGALLAGLTAKSGTLAGFAHAVRIDGWNLIRVGVLLSAVYLGWRVRQGRRPRRVPSWYRTPHA
ncbi:MAG TPA: hypothetical protein VGI74_16665 [Streptosporangiaceae bacterium]